MTDETPVVLAVIPAVEMREPKVDYRDVMPIIEIPNDVEPEPTLVKLIALDLKNDTRRATDISGMLKR